MENKTSLIAEIFTRRIPQIIGMYIAAVWLAVEIADWMSGRFAISANFSAYVFVGMLTFLPSVIVLAWGHGRPGRDHWSVLELSWLPINLILSFFAIQFWVNPVETDEAQPKEPPQAIQTLVSSSKVAVNKIEKTHKSTNKVISFFWQNNTGQEAFNWLSYGSSWLFAQDLKRTPLISVSTPYDSKNILSDIISKGFDDGQNVPLPLALQIATRFSRNWVVMGGFALIGKNIEFTAKLYDAKSGKLQKEFTETHEEWLTALDKISFQVSEYLIASQEHNKDNIIPDLSISDHTTSNIEAIKKLIIAKNSVAFHNDYSAGIKEILKSIELDNNFADAHVLASQYYRGQGDFDKSIAYIRSALELDYKLYEEAIFQLKANLFAMSGDGNKALLVLENWTELFPKSSVALTTLGRQYLMLENKLDQAKEVYEKLSTLEGDEQASLVNLGKIYRVQNQQDKSIDVLEKYLAVNPKKVEAYLELADAYKQFSMFEKAKEIYQQASIIGSKDYLAEIGMANTDAMMGDYTSALVQLDQLYQKSQTDHQIVNVINAKIVILTATGQIDEAFKALEVLSQSAKNTMAPLSYLFTIEGTRVQLLVLQNKYQQALSKTDTIISETKPPFSEVAELFYLSVYQAMEDKENFERVLANFEKYIVIFPIPYYNKFVLVWKGKIAYWNKDYNEAIKLFDQAISEYTQSIISLQFSEVMDEIRYQKAESLLQLKQVEEANATLHQILMRNPMFADAYRLKAKIFMQKKDSVMATEMINKAKQILKDADDDFIGLKKLKDLERELLESSGMP